MIKIFFDLESILQDKDLYPFYEYKDLFEVIDSKSKKILIIKTFRIYWLFVYLSLVYWLQIHQ